MTWPLWQRWAAEVEQLGFAGLYRSDHFTLIPPLTQDAPELVVSLTYLADHTQRIRFGPLVAPLSFRDPVMLAWQAATLDALSDGRMILGVGAGWNQPEHARFGYALGDISARMARLEEGLEVITRLLRSDAPVSYAGRFFQLEHALLRPPRPGGPPILIGGAGPKRTLPLVARYADIWNGTQLTPAEFRERSTQLDELLRMTGRNPSDVKRTMMAVIFCGRDPTELERRVSGVRRAFPDQATMPLEDLLATWRARGNLIAGSPDTVVEQIQAYGAAGAEEMILQWGTFDDFEGLESLAQHVLPYV
jgi:alkanesulfonate monooxygenase SsuD/methylene tetrahydromethanopterin reductase-like flavin-dependent oxidoreductase (luciferase family)